RLCDCGCLVQLRRQRSVGLGKNRTTEKVAVAANRAHNDRMGCFLWLFALLTPRVVIVLVWLFNAPYLRRAYETFIWPILGFIFMPLTTLAYAWAHNSTDGNIRGFPLVIVVIAVLMDMGSWG